MRLLICNFYPEYTGEKYCFYNYHYIQSLYNRLDLKQFYIKSIN
jgi:hypothetical protein